MENEFNITQPILIEMFLQIANAMSYVASERIVHNDLACRFLSFEWNQKIF
jgi:hypothetical protein